MVCLIYIRYGTKQYTKYYHEFTTIDTFQAYMIGAKDYYRRAVLALVKGESIENSGDCKRW